MTWADQCVSYHPDLSPHTGALVTFLAIVWVQQISHLNKTAGDLSSSPGPENTASDRNIVLIRQPRYLIRLASHWLILHWPSFDWLESYDRGSNSHLGADDANNMLEEPFIRSITTVFYLNLAQDCLIFCSALLFVSCCWHKMIIMWQPQPWLRYPPT